MYWPILEYKEHKFNDYDPVSECLLSFSSDKYGKFIVHIFLHFQTKFKNL